MKDNENEALSFNPSETCRSVVFNGNLIQPFIALMHRYDTDPGHAIQVARLSMRLFDELASLHRLGGRERFLLNAAAVCHDIGWSQQVKKHNKGSRDLIVNHEIPNLSGGQKIIIALIARYHRGKMPKSKHRYYADLSPRYQLLVSKLAALLRIADGLDRTHVSVVDDVAAYTDGRKVVLHLLTRRDASQERWAVAQKKKDLFERVFTREVELVENRME